MTFFLVTTADERTWKFDRPIIFLGEWCLRHDRKHIWQKTNSIVADPFGLEVSERERNLAYVEILSRRLLVELVDVLNQHHGTTHSLRYWNIVLGHWLKRYVATLFNRFFTLEKTICNAGPLETILLDSANYSLATKDSEEFILATDDDEWNHVLYGEILNFLGGVKIISDQNLRKGLNSLRNKEILPPKCNFDVIKLSLKLVSFVNNKIGTKDDAFIMNSYLPFWGEIKLQIHLGQWPKFWRSPFLKRSKFDVLVRKSFKLDVGNTTGFEKFVRQQLGFMIPTCYLEGYAHLVSVVETLPWPSKPRYIFTSGSFDTNEVFKVWAGRKVEQGVPYFTGQHGNNYGTHLYYGNASWPERSTADQFISWGEWRGERKGVTPAFIFKIAGKSSRRFDSSGGLLLVEDLLAHRCSVNDIHHTYSSYQKAQFRFVERLPAHIHSRLTVRLRGTFEHGSWCDDQRWADASPNTKVERGIVPMDQLVRKNRLVVHSYDSTGVLETFALNIPTLCFWSEGIDHVLPVMKRYYEGLRSAGILIESPEQAAEFVASNWEDIDGWWESAQVQSARQEFCAQFARAEKNPTSYLSRLLEKLAIELASRESS